MTESFLALAERRPPVHEAFVTLLIENGCTKRDAQLMVEHRGLAGQPPRPLRSNSLRLSAERVRQVVKAVEDGAMQSLLRSGGEELHALRDDVAATLRRIERHAPGSDDDIKSALAAEFDPLDALPASVVRIADLLGIPHGLRLAVWTSRSKFADSERVNLASFKSGARSESVTGIVPDQMPEVFDNFINFARKHSRGAGVVAAAGLAERYALDRGIALAPHEAEAFLRPFAVHLGRHEGDEWFAFFNSANEFVHRASTRIGLFGQCSFELLRQFHDRNTRSRYASSSVPESVLRAALELAGYSVEGDEIRPMKPLPVSARSASELQARMVQVFRDTAAREGRKSVRRGELLQALLKAGIRESTARVYLGARGLFHCKKGLCRLADELQSDEQAQFAAAVVARAPAGEAQARGAVAL